MYLGRKPRCLWVLSRPILIIYVWASKGLCVLLSAASCGEELVWICLDGVCVGDKGRFVSGLLVRVLIVRHWCIGFSCWASARNDRQWWKPAGQAGSLLFANVVRDQGQWMTVVGYRFPPGQGSVIIGGSRVDKESIHVHREKLGDANRFLDNVQMLLINTCLPLEH